MLYKLANSRLLFKSWPHHDEKDENCQSYTHKRCVGDSALNQVRAAQGKISVGEEESDAASDEQ